jgi:hypothetical protein
VTANLTRRLDFYTEMVRSRAFTRSGLAVAFVLLYRHYNGRSGRCDPSLATLARETGLTKRSVVAGVDELRESGWWQIAQEGAATRGGRTNSYAPQFEIPAPASGEEQDTTFAPKVVKHTIPVRAESGEAQRQKVVKRASPRTKKEPRVPARAHAREVEDCANSAFETFWRIYPHRGEFSDPKHPARLKFETAVKRGVDPAAIIAGAERYRTHAERERIEPRFRPQAQKWLNKGHWAEFYEPEPPQLRVGMN